MTDATVGFLEAPRLKPGSPRSRQRTSRRGSSIVEFALGWSVLWLMFSGIYQFGYTFYVYNRLQTAISNAAVYGSRIDYDTASTSTFTNAIKNMAVYGDPSGGTTPVVPGLTTSNININVNPEDSMPTDVTITVQNYSIDSIFKTYTLTNKPRVTTVYMGRITCSTC